MILVHTLNTKKICVNNVLLTYLLTCKKPQKVLFNLFFSRNIELVLHLLGYGLYIIVDNKRINIENYLFTDYFGKFDVSLFRLYIHVAKMN